MAAAAAAKEAIWLRKILCDLSYEPETPAVLSVDNQSAIKRAKNPEFHKRTKHIDIKFHFIRQNVVNGELSVEYIPSTELKADIFTKAFPKQRFLYIRELLNLGKRCDF